MWKITLVTSYIGCSVAAGEMTTTHHDNLQYLYSCPTILHRTGDTRQGGKFVGRRFTFRSRQRCQQCGFSHTGEADQSDSGVTGLGHYRHREMIVRATHSTW